MHVDIKHGMINWVSIGMVGITCNVLIRLRDVYYKVLGAHK